jgi:hypothetical protein
MNNATISLVDKVFTEHTSLKLKMTLTRERKTASGFTSPTALHTMRTLSFKEKERLPQLQHETAIHFQEVPEPILENTLDST